MTHIHLERTIWPVGHGAFYTEQFTSGRGNTITVAYDCGSERQGLISHCIDAIPKPIDVLFISHLHSDHIKGLHYLLHLKKVKKVILPNLLPEKVLEAIVYNFISAASDPELQIENMQLQELLLSLYRGEYDETITQVGEEGSKEANIVFDEENGVRLTIPQRLKGSVEIVLCTPQKPIWRYKPVYYLPGDACQKLKDEVNNLLGGNLIKGKNIDWNELLAYLGGLNKTKSGNIDCADLINIYNKCFPKHEDEQAHNNYSMPVYSGPIGSTELLHVHPAIWYKHRLMYPYFDECYHLYFDILINHSSHCLYTGDFEAKDPDKLNKLKQELGNLWPKVGLLQVPHHYSKNNYDVDLYDHRMLCFGNVNDKKDKSFCFSTYDKIAYEGGCCPIVVTEAQYKKLYMIYELITTTP